MTQNSPNTGSSDGRMPERDDDMDTGTPDSTYALISTAYHLLQGADTISMFIEDAEEDGNEEIAEFLEETRAEFIERAEEAKRLLASVLADSLGDEEDDDDSST